MIVKLAKKPIWRSDYTDSNHSMITKWANPTEFGE